MTTLTVSKCTESSNGGYILTLKQGIVDTPFGKQPATATYYMKVEGELGLGFSADINLDDYTIVERSFTTDEGKDLILKWLHIN